MPHRVYKLRLAKAMTIQSPFTSALSAMSKFVDDPPAHPYGSMEGYANESAQNCERIGKRIRNYRPFTHGIRRQRIQVQDDYLYRITSIDSLMNIWRMRAIQQPPSTDPTSEFEAPLFDARVHPYSTSFSLLKDICNKGFVPLETFVGGSLVTFRTGTWWTDRKCEPGSIFNDRLICGMCYGLVRPVILRLDVQALHARAKEFNSPEDDDTYANQVSGPFLPLEVDGFDYPAFNPMPYDAESSEGGRTLDLSTYPTIRMGPSEYIIYNVPTSIVSICPGQFDLDDCSDAAQVQNRLIINNRLPEFWNTLNLYHEFEKAEDQG